METRRQGMRGLAAALSLLGLLLTGAGTQAAEPLCSLDVDGTGQAGALTDGLLLIRHLVGFTGNALTNGAVGSGCTRCNGADISAHLDTTACQILFDTDGNGARDALTDGLVVIRYLAGFTGEILTNDAIGSGAVRTAGDAIADWLARAVRPAGEAPQRVELVAATSLRRDTIDLEWLATFDNDTPAEEIRYRLHAGTDPRIVPDAGTANTEIIDAAEGTLTGLTAQTLYYVKVEARDNQGHSSWSNELSVVTAAEPVESSAPRQLLDAQSAPDQNHHLHQRPIPAPPRPEPARYRRPHRLHPRRGLPASGHLRGASRGSGQHSDRARRPQRGL